MRNVFTHSAIEAGRGDFEGIFPWPASYMAVLVTLARQHLARDVYNIRKLSLCLLTLGAGGLHHSAVDACLKDQFDSR